MYACFAEHVISSPGCQASSVLEPGSSLNTGNNGLVWNSTTDETDPSSTSNLTLGIPGIPGIPKPHIPYWRPKRIIRVRGSLGWTIESYMPASHIRRRDLDRTRLLNAVVHFNDTLLQNCANDPMKPASGANRPVLGIAVPEFQRIHDGRPPIGERLMMEIRRQAQARDLTYEVFVHILTDLHLAYSLPVIERAETYMKVMFQQPGTQTKVLKGSFFIRQYQRDVG